MHAPKNKQQILGEREGTVDVPQVHSTVTGKIQISHIQIEMKSQIAPLFALLMNKQAF